MQDTCELLCLFKAGGGEPITLAIFKKAYPDFNDLMADSKGELAVYRFLGTFFVVNIVTLFSIVGFSVITFVCTEELIFSKKT